MALKTGVKLPASTGKSAPPRERHYTRDIQQGHDALRRAVTVRRYGDRVDRYSLLGRPLDEVALIDRVHRIDAVGDHHDDPAQSPVAPVARRALEHRDRAVDRRE